MATTEDTVVEKEEQLSQRRSRRVFWGAVDFSISVGRALSRLGMHSGEVRTLRKLGQLGAKDGMSLPGISCAILTINVVNVRIYTHVGKEDPRPVLVYAHGGGWVMGSARDSHAFALELCRDIGATLISVDYRLAPEHPYPAGLDDCLAVIRTVLQANDQLPQELKGVIDVSRVVLAGDSAGGNLIACAALDMVRCADDRRPCGVILISPVMQGITQSFDSFKKFNSYVKADISWFVPRYAGIEPSDEVRNACREGRHLPQEMKKRLLSNYMTLEEAEEPNGEKIVEIPKAVTDLVTCARAWPLLAEDSELAQLPAMMVQVSSQDPLMDEARVFVERMRRAGTKDVRYSFLAPAQHAEALLSRRFETKSGKLGYEQIVSFFKDVTGDAN